MSAVLYLDTSAALRAVLERGISPDVERRLATARYLITSRLSLVESGRALHRLRATGISEPAIADAGRELDSLWARCAIWEMTANICELAGRVSPQIPLRTLDALHLASWLDARRRIGSDVELITADLRLERASQTV